MDENTKLEDLIREYEQVEEKKQETEAAAEQVEDTGASKLLRPFVTPGTLACGFGCMVGFLALAALLLSCGFWKTLLVVVMGCVGCFLGGVKHKTQWVKDQINRLFPPKH